MTESDHVVISRGEACSLGSIEAIKAYFATADFTVPPLVIVAPPAEADTLEPASATACFNDEAMVDPARVCGVMGGGK